jgi:hypothetical protein
LSLPVGSLFIKTISATLVKYLLHFEFYIKLKLAAQMFLTKDIA